MKRLSPLGYLVLGTLLLTPAFGDTFTYILVGKVVMEDGSAPPKAVGIERVCSDVNGSAPGPFTNKKGEYTWRVDINAENTRACVLQGVLQGYQSTQVALNVNIHTGNLSTMTMPEITMVSKDQDPRVLVINNDGVPTKILKPWKDAMGDLDKGDFPAAAAALEQTMPGAPKFPRGWHTLGLIYTNIQKYDKAREAFQKSIEQDPKYLPGYVMVDRMCVRFADWACVTKSSEDIMKLDVKKTFESEMLLHEASAKFAAKDLSGAESTVQQSMSLDKGHKNARSEYVLGRILEAKGDLEGAKDHMNKYLELAPMAADADQIRAHLQIMGKPGAAAAQQPSLELE